LAFERREAELNLLIELRRLGAVVVAGAVDRAGIQVQIALTARASDRRGEVMHAFFQAREGTESGPVHHHISIEELKSASRAGRISWARQVAIHLARQHTGASLSVIGQAFGGRNHATVLHACRRVAERITTDPEVARDLGELSKLLGEASADRDC